MANYCNNKIAIIGYDKEKVDSVRKLMVESFRESRNGTIRDFVIKCGYSKDEAIRITDARDTFIDINDEINKKDGVYYTQNIEILPIEKRVFFVEGLVANVNDYRVATAEELAEWDAYKKQQEEEML